MRSDLNFEEVRDIFINIEKEYSVFDLSYEGIYYWKLIRMELFSQIIRKIGFVKAGHPKSKVDKINRFINLLKFSVRNLIKRRNLKQCDTLLLTHGRKSYMNGNYEDIYLYDIIKDLEESKSRYLIMDRPDYYGNHVWDGRRNSFYFERFGHVTREVLYPIFINKINLDETMKIIREIESTIHVRFKFTVDLERLIRKKIFRFKIEKKYYGKLLDKIQPKTIYILVSYGKEELISSAKDYGIKTIEIQHGIINNYHMGYFFPFDFPIPYFPDEIYTFGQFWIDSVTFPVNCKQIAKSFSCLKPDYSNIYKRDSKCETVLFLSQGTIGDQLSEIAARFIQNNDMKIYYKLHPSEFSVWKDRYIELTKHEMSDNVRIITDEIPINELFNTCKYVVGVNSTAILEALLYECNTYVINIEGYQYMEYLIKNNYVKLMPKDFDIRELIDNTTKIVEDKDFFYK